MVAAYVALVACSSTRPTSTGTEALDGGSPRPDGAADDANAPDDANAVADATIDVDAAAPGIACLGDELAPVDGGGAAIACPSSGTCTAACGRIVDRYKAGVAQFAVGCILALPSCASSDDVVSCVDLALSRACPDPTSAGYCAALVTTCDPDAGGVGSMISQEGCESVAHGLRDAGRADLAACIQTKIDAGTCATEVGTCADDIRE